MLKWPVVLALLLSFCFVGTVGSVVLTDKQIRGYFQMPDSVGVVPQHVESAILEQLPIGSGEAQVQRFLQSRNIGLDGRSSCQTADAERRIRCNLGLNGHSWELLHETYTIEFTFERSRLTAVAVQHRFRAGFAHSLAAR